MGIIPASQKGRVTLKTSSIPKFRPILVIISGPSGVGKDAVFSHIRKLGYPFHYVTTATTRKPRTDESDGADYHFLSRDEFKERIAQKKLLEWAEVYGNYYGIPREEIEPLLKKGRDVIVKVDVQGAATISKLFPEAVTIFLMPPSKAELERRLKQRYSESYQELERRLKTASKEIESAHLFRHVIVNYTDKLESTVKQIEKIVAQEKKG